MLKHMRKHAKYFYVLFFIVILSFVFWGVGTVDKTTTVSVAEIGKEKITLDEYWKTYERLRATYRDIAKGQLDEEMEKKLNLKESALNGLIDEKILLIAAREWSVDVTDQEIQDLIANDPRFMRDGVFRKDIYFRTLELNRLTPELFEQALRQERTTAKMRLLIWSVVDAPSGLTGPQQGIDQARVFADRNAAVRSFIEAMKNRLQVKVNTNLIS